MAMLYFLTYQSYGRPGLEYHATLSPKAPILKIFPVNKMVSVLQPHESGDQRISGMFLFMACVIVDASLMDG